MRVVVCFWMMGFSWVLVPSYQGTLLSFIFIPFRHRPVDTLEELRGAMESSNMSLGVTDGSSSHGILVTGGGVYKEIWDILKERENWEISSVKSGLRRYQKRRWSVLHKLFIA